MRSPPLGPELRELLQEAKHDELRELLDDFHPRDAAEILTCLEPAEITEIMTLLPIVLERDIFAYLEPELQEQIAVGSGRERVRLLLAAMSSDDLAEFMENLDERVRDQLVELLPTTAQADLARREQYEDDQVGSIMTTEFCVLSQEFKPGEAIAELRRQAPNRETIYYSYVVDLHGCLIGFVSLRDVMLARDDEQIRDIMKTDLVSALVTEDQEDAAKKIREYDLLALPVVDRNNRLVGLITHDDAIDIIEEEMTEDIEQFAGITPKAEHQEYADRTVVSHFKGRVMWLSILAASCLGIAMIIQGFENEMSMRGLIFAAFLPMILATGANVGGQTSALVLRGLATGSLTAASLRRVLWTELRVGFLLAGALGMVGLGVTALYLTFFAGDPATTIAHCITIAIALSVHVVSAACLGALIPMTVSKLGKSPEIFSHPALNAVADTVAVLIYMCTIRLLLPALLPA